MKRMTNKLTASILTVLVVLLLASCSSYVFNSAWGGKAVDKSEKINVTTTSGTTTTKKPIEGMQVYVYPSESARSAAASAWKTQTQKEYKEFYDNSVPSTRTDANGDFSIPTVRWSNSNPQFGKDGDSTVIYPLFYSKDYGLIDTEEGVNIQSDSNNTRGRTYEFDKVVNANTFTINFKDKDNNATNTANANIADTSGFTFSYEYFDGNEWIGETSKTPSNGSSAINISYDKDKKYDDPSTEDKEEKNKPYIKIYDIKPSSDWTYSSSSATDNNGTYYVSLADKSSVNFYFENVWEEATITVNLKDGALSSRPVVADSTITMKYSYKDNDGATKSDTIQAVNGVLTIPVRYKGDSTTVTLSNFKSPSKSYALTIDTSGNNDDGFAIIDGKANDATPLTDKNTITFKVNKDDTAYVADLFVKKLKLSFPGATGYLYSKINETTGVIGTATDNGITVMLYPSDINGTVADGAEALTPTVQTTSTRNNVGTDRGEADNGYFTGLGAGYEVTLNYKDATSYTSDSIYLLIEYKNNNGTATKTNTILEVNSKTSAGDYSHLMIDKTKTATSRSLRSSASTLTIISPSEE